MLKSWAIFSSPNYGGDLYEKIFNDPLSYLVFFAKDSGVLADACFTVVYGSVLGQELNRV